MPTSRAPPLDRLAALYGLERERDEADNALRRRVFEVAVLPTTAYDVLRAVNRFRIPPGRRSAPRAGRAESLGPQPAIGGLLHMKWSLSEYNLICYGRADDDIFRRSAGTDAFFFRTRLFESTSDDLMSRYQNDLNGLAELPALVVAEAKPGGAPVTPAFLSLIDNIRISGDKIMFGFNHLYKISSEEVFGCEYFNIDAYENSRTHWAIKRGNLAEGFFKLLQDARQDAREADYPRFFRVEQWPLPNLGHVAVMMPFAAEFNDVYEAIKAACRTCRIEALRVDEIYKTTKIMDDVFAAIAQSRLVICDLTGRNANVLYESGLAHALNCDVILVTQAIEDVPFDLRQFRVIKYLSNQEGLSKLTTDLERTIQETLEETPRRG